MRRSYLHFSFEERCELAQCRAGGHSIRANLGSSASRAIEHLSRAEAQRRPPSPLSSGYAAEQAKARRWRGSLLRSRPQTGPRPAWASPCMQTAAATRFGASLSAINYLPFHHRRDRLFEDYAWPSTCPRSGRRGRHGGIRALRIKAGFSLPCGPIGRQPRQPRHWEADLMLFRTYRHALLIPAVILPPPTAATQQTAAPVAAAIQPCLLPSTHFAKPHLHNGPSSLNTPPHPTLGSNFFC